MTALYMWPDEIKTRCPSSWDSSAPEKVWSDAQGLLMSTLSLAAQCWADPRVARVASTCVLQACEGALNVDMNIPETIASGLLTAIQANQDPDVSTFCIYCLITSIRKHSGLLASTCKNQAVPHPQLYTEHIPKYKLPDCAHAYMRSSVWPNRWNRTSSLLWLTASALGQTLLIKRRSSPRFCRQYIMHWRLLAICTGQVGLVYATFLILRKDKKSYHPSV